MGVREGDPVPFFTVMDEIGVDLIRHRRKTFDSWRTLLRPGDFPVAGGSSPGPRADADDGLRRRYWTTLDPSMIDGNRDARLTVYRQVRDILSAHIKKRFPIIGGPTVYRPYIVEVKPGSPL